jgi:hypothetical protein
MRNLGAMGDGAAEVGCGRGREPVRAARSRTERQAIFGSLMETWPITLNPRHNRTRFTLITRSSRAGLSVFDANLMTVANTRSAAPAAVGGTSCGRPVAGWQRNLANADL